jgi:hypothetical protein
LAQVIKSYHARPSFNACRYVATSDAGFVSRKPRSQETENPGTREDSVGLIPGFLASCSLSECFRLTYLRVRNAAKERWHSGFLRALANPKNGVYLDAFTSQYLLLLTGL